MKIKIIQITLFLGIFIGGSIIQGFYQNELTGSSNLQLLKPKVLGAITTPPGTIEIDLGYNPPNFQLNSPFSLDGVSAGGVFVFDASTGQVLAEKNAHVRTSIASLTKLLVALISYEQFSQDESLLVTKDCLISITPILKLQVGDEILVKDLINSILVGSSNDAAQCLASTLESKLNLPLEEILNQKAQNLSLQNSHFNNALGFDSNNHYSSPYDVRVILGALFNYQNFNDLGRLTKYSFSSVNGRPYTAKATNKLIAAHPELYAIKTGFTPGAKEAMVTKFIHQNREIVIIVLSSDDRETDTLTLKERISKSFELEEIKFR